MSTQYRDAVTVHGRHLAQSNERSQTHQRTNMALCYTAPDVLEAVVVIVLLYPCSTPVVVWWCGGLVVVCEG